jgi:dihydrodipicolinate synthase/N-acetylneuraminate lyase
MRTGRLIRPEEYGELAQEYPNLVATKYGAGDPETVAAMLHHAPQLRHFFTEYGYYLGAPLGECGLLSSLSSSNPQRARAYFNAGVEHDQPAFAAMYSELAAMMGALRQAAGGLGLNDGAYDKIVSKVAEPDFPLRLLPPYQTSTDAGYARYYETLQKHYPAWLPNAA